MLSASATSATRTFSELTLPCDMPYAIGTYKQTHTRTHRQRYCIYLFDENDKGLTVQKMVYKLCNPYREKSRRKSFCFLAPSHLFILYFFSSYFDLSSSFWKMIANHFIPSVFVFISMPFFSYLFPFYLVDLKFCNIVHHTTYTFSNVCITRNIFPFECHVNVYIINI